MNRISACQALSRRSCALVIFETLLAPCVLKRHVSHLTAESTTFFFFFLFLPCFVVRRVNSRRMFLYEPTIQQPQGRAARTVLAPAPTSAPTALYGVRLSLQPLGVVSSSSSPLFSTRQSPKLPRDARRFYVPLQVSIFSCSLALEVSVAWGH